MGCCRITDLHNKEVINLHDGRRIGCVDDVEVDTRTAQLVSIVVHGRPKGFGFLGREEDIVIRWCDIDVIGEDAVLVHFEMAPCPMPPPPPRRSGFFSGIFRD